MAKSTATVSRPEWFQSFLDGFEAAEYFATMFHTATTDYVRSGEPVSDYLSRVLSGPFQCVVRYTVSDGIRFAQPSMEPIFRGVVSDELNAYGIGDPNAPLMLSTLETVRLLLAFLRKAPAQSACVIFERLDNMVGEIVPVDANVIELMEMIHNAGTDKALESHGNPLLMLTPSFEDIRPQVRTLTSGIKPIEIPMPDYDQRLAYAKVRLAEEPDVVLSDITVEQLASLTAGLLRRHIENIVVRARPTANSPKPGKLTRELASKVQRELMDAEYARIVKRIDKPFKLSDVGGLVEAKAHAEKRIIKPLRNGSYDLAPTAVLYVGPPGTGKTMLAAATANDSGLNCLEVDLSQVLGGIVGQTESNIATLRRAIIANAPCAVFLDEIDQKARRGEGGSDSGGGGAVENRLFAAILELTGDVSLWRRIGVTFIFASNRPELLDPAFMSRMQAVIPMLPAEDDAARADVLQRILARMGQSSTVESLLPFASKVENWSNRDIEQVCSEAVASVKLDEVSLAEALEETIKWRRADTSNVTKQIREALKVAKDLRLVPEKYRNVQVATPKSDWSEDEAPRKVRRLDWNSGA